MCNSLNEYIFPRSTRIEEIWPGLLTKAILKIYSNQIRNTGSFNEIGELSVIYSLTGFIPEHVKITDSNKIQNMLYLVCSENYFMNISKFVMGYNEKSESYDSFENSLNKASIKMEVNYNNKTEEKNSINSNVNKVITKQGFADKYRRLSGVSSKLSTKNTFKCKIIY